jgi:hypothetical protein
MDFYQGVVTEYLRANRATFINPEFLLQIDAGLAPKGRSWWVDALAVNFKEQRTYLCEVTYAQELGALLKRLAEWATHWSAIRIALTRDAGIPVDWVVRPWIFIPETLVPRFTAKRPQMPCVPRVTPLEMCQPWRFCTWDHPREHDKPACVPPEMCA